MGVRQKKEKKESKQEGKQTKNLERTLEPIKALFSKVNIRSKCVKVLGIWSDL